MTGLMIYCAYITKVPRELWQSCVQVHVVMHVCLTTHAELVAL